MKNFYLLSLIGLGLAANAQQGSKLPQAKNNHVMPAVSMTKMDYVVPSPVRVNNNKTNTQSGYGKAAAWTVVGTTQFDRQTNNSVYRRILAYTGGKVSVTWNASTDGPNANFLGRGSGYNHFNGTTWGPVSSNRIEDDRAGYPNIDVHGTNEIIMSHRVDTNGKSGGLIYNTNAAIGSTTWTSNIVLPPVTNQPSVLWPRTAVSGDYMHVLANYTTPSTGQPGDTVVENGVKSPTVYSRYKFSTSTWDIQNITLPGYSSARTVNGDADGYALSASGANVAILMGSNTGDITLWKSTDNGTNWTQTILDSFPYPAYKNTPFTDTLDVTDGSLSVKIDNTGKAHCFWGHLRISWRFNTSDLGVFLGTNAIKYWYEGRPDSIVTVAGTPDMNGNGELDLASPDERTRYGNAPFATMPYAEIAPNGDIYLVYSAPTEDDIDAQGANFRDVYIVFSKDNGVTWSDIQNLTAPIGFSLEQMFGSIAISDNKLHLTFIQSDAIGFYDPINNPNKVGVFDIMYYGIPLADIDALKVGLAPELKKNNLFSITQNYPNPFTGSTVIPVKLNNNADVTVTVMNMVGQAVYTKTFSNTLTGMNDLEITPSDLKPGIYFYNVEAGGFKASGKMMAR